VLVHELACLLDILLRPDGDEFVCGDIMHSHRVRVVALGYHVRDDVAVGNDGVELVSVHDG
jgi:hypothetical protein